MEDPAAWSDEWPENPPIYEGRHMSRAAALDAADPTESHEISRCAPCPASDPRQDATKCYAGGAHVPHASTEKAA